MRFQVKPIKTKCRNVFANIICLRQEKHTFSIALGILIGIKFGVKGFKMLLFGQKLQSFIQILENKRLQNCNKPIFIKKYVKLWKCICATL